MAVENAHRKTDTAGVAIRALESLRILAINNRSISFLNEETIYPGQEISIVGRGFLVEYTVWFGTTSVLTQVSISGGAMLRVQVPASVAPGPCAVYFGNGNGKSNVVSVTVE